MARRPKYVHWSCFHGEAGIRHLRRVIPNKAAGGVSWWTDLHGKGQTIRQQLGLTSNILECDRMAIRFWADPRDERLLIPWVLYKPQVSEAWAWELENSPGAAPEHWWVATEPIRVKR